MASRPGSDQLRELAKSSYSPLDDRSRSESLTRCPERGTGPPVPAQPCRLSAFTASVRDLIRDWPPRSSRVVGSVARSMLVQVFMSDPTETTHANPHPVSGHRRPEEIAEDEAGPIGEGDPRVVAERTPTKKLSQSDVALDTTKTRDDQELEQDRSLE
jgi:hypothetical protein